MSIIQRQRNWKELNHFGRKGNDDGIDIFAVDDNSQTWFFQCKRYSSISSSELIKIIYKIRDQNGTLPNVLAVFVACDISKTAQETFIAEAKKIGIYKTHVWTASIIESDLYAKYHDLLFIYFGINIPKEKQNNAAKVKHGLRMKKKIEKDFIRKDLDIHYITKHVLFEPRLRFEVGEIIIRNIDNDIYPEIDKDSSGMSPWFKSEIYDLYHNGIEIYLFYPYEIIVDKDGSWDLLKKEEDERKKRYETYRVNRVGRIPFFKIIEYDFEGDGYYPMPHLYCKFDLDGMPYESIEYYTFGNSDNRNAPFHFENKLRRKLK
ncbi:MAG: hypothetical protein HC831_28090 [Chloroflexia bacterium]|nr:hypothetical protein [Chloroflexia bacterium]